ncbi:MAG: transporter substrate-binding domain-containing protein [Alphaproteobacteria bacterium]|jgi:polar amino acid transport system substrate-binding protein|nr:transporter substrate-binding domain-containing protein [Alphaproteobacteria bacterium]MDP6830835.1 transporter substrate-binding domain-containing protein [Alphaproteobacteria bacterium]
MYSNFLLKFPGVTALALLLAPLLAPSAQARDRVAVVTETWKPYSYEENGIVKGSATKIVRAVLERAGIDYSIQVYPWARAYKTALNRESVVLFAVVRTEEREKLFKPPFPR